MYLHEDHEVLHEVELGVIISKEGKNIKEKDFMEYIKGYFLCIDFTEKNLLMKGLNEGHPWFLSKGMD